ncbi:hypothetical protein ACQ4PT_052255 [Festuca glaucescens]
MARLMPWMSSGARVQSIDGMAQPYRTKNSLYWRISSCPHGTPSTSARDREAAIHAWLRSPTLDSLQELEFWFNSYYRPQPLQQSPPPSTFRFPATLRVLTIGNCNLPDSTVQELQLHFPLLKHLGLEHVSISECSLHGLITACPALECLLISHGFGFRGLKINSLTLRSVCVKNYRLCNDQLKELIVENAPCLQTLLHEDFDYGLHVWVVSAPKLETLGCLSDGFYISGQDDLSRIVFGSTVIQEASVREEGFTRRPVSLYN